MKTLVVRGFHASNPIFLQPVFFKRLSVGTNSENGNNVASLDDAQAVAAVLGIPQGPTSIQGSKSNLAEAYSPQAERSYADVVRDNRSTHSIELIK